MHCNQLIVLDTLIVKKVDFVPFIATVLNCTAQVSKKSKKSKKLDILIYILVDILIYRSKTSWQKHYKDF